VDDLVLADDEMLVSQVLAGQTEQFRVLVKRHQKAVYGLGYSFLRNAEDTADFVQEVFLKAYRNLGLFEGRSRFSTWLYKIAYNTAINQVQRRKPSADYQSLADAEGPVPKALANEESPEREVMRKTLRDAVREAVKELPERFRVCIDLFYFYDRSYQEIERITGIALNTIKSHVFRAKKLLKEKLKEYMEGGV
jgi:RNA polymerase sigma-70 factor (ECF subfamily)